MAAIMQNVADAFGNLGQKLMTNQSDIARQVAKNGFDSISNNPGKYAASFYKKTAGEAVDKNIAQALSKASFDKGGRLVADGVDNKTLRTAQDAISNQKNMLKNVVDANEIDADKLKWLKEQQGKVGGAYEVGKAYFTEEGKSKARIGTAAAGAVGLRYLSGGTLTRNNTGKRDIVGVPFI